MTCYHYFIIHLHCIISHQLPTQATIQWMKQYLQRLFISSFMYTPLCNVEIKKNISPSIENVEDKHLQQLFLYGYYFMQKYSLDTYHCILTDSSQWYPDGLGPESAHNIEISVSWKSTSYYLALINYHF